MSWRLLLSCIFVVWSIGVLQADDKRTWTDNSGKFRLIAELVENDGKTITLRREDGKTVKVPIDRLSKADQDYLKSQTKEASDSADPPAGKLSYLEDGIQKQLTTSFAAPFGLHAPQNSEPLFVILELSGDEIKNATQYGQLRIKPLQANNRKRLKPIKDKFLFKDPSKEFVDFGPFAKEGRHRQNLLDVRTPGGFGDSSSQAGRLGQAEDRFRHDFDTFSI